MEIKCNFCLIYIRFHKSAILTNVLYTTHRLEQPTGPCTVPAWAIKDGKAIIVPHLTYVINECIKSNVFPDELKKANITPVFKKDDPLEATNYRPISVTNAFSKIFERVLHSQIYDYLFKNDVMNPLQFGFRKGFSTHDALLYLTESIRYEIDKNKIVHYALLDLSKAFDSICHQKLLSKLFKLVLIITL